MVNKVTMILYHVNFYYDSDLVFLPENDYIVLL
jgi:hypothetical protein